MEILENCIVNATISIEVSIQKQIREILLKIKKIKIFKVTIDLKSFNKER